MTNTPSEPNPPPASGVERVLSLLLLVVVAVSIVCFLATIIGTFMGMTGDDFNSGIWPVVSLLPLFGLPIAFLMIVTVLILNARRRRRTNA